MKREISLYSRGLLTFFLKDEYALSKHRLRSGGRGRQEEGVPKSIKSKPQWKQPILMPYEGPIMNMRANGDSLSTIQSRLKSRGVVVSKMTVQRFLAAIPPGRLQRSIDELHHSSDR